MNNAVLTADHLQTLPPEWPEELRPRNRQALEAGPAEKLVVLDDDPTGTQTVYDVPVLTEWSVASLREVFAGADRGFYVLTNSRSLPPAQAGRLTRQLAEHLLAAADGHPFTVVSRSDSTLRGHYPLETDVLADELGPFDATVLVPCFQAGGRCTIDGVHYVADGQRLVPAAETPFAADAAFGYRHSDLRQWVEEKTAGRVSAADVVTIPIEAIRRGGPSAVAEQLLLASAGAVVVVDAVTGRDLDVLIAGLMEVERQGRRFLFRTAADFVAARLALTPRSLLTPAELDLGASGGGLIVAGSYVPATTAQLGQLRSESGLVDLELDVSVLLDSSSRAAEIERAADLMNGHLAEGRNVLVATSRQVTVGHDAQASLGIGRSISQAVVDVVRRLAQRPRYLVAKGGITSSDIATEGLGVRCARVLGQVLPGVPVWRLGTESRFPGLSYVVFPGNVGSPDSLRELYRTLSL